MKSTSTAREDAPVPSTACFPHEYRAGVVLITEVENLSESEPVDSGKESDVDLAQKLAWALGDLLSCVATEWITGLTADQGVQRRAVDTLAQVDSSLVPADESLDFAFVVGHGSSSHGTIGGMDAATVAAHLDSLGVKESVVLVCGGGCPNIGATLSEGRVVIACGADVDVRNAYVFGLNYLWKRFGSGASPAQSLGASNVVLPADPYQLWYNQVVM